MTKEPEIFISFSTSDEFVADFIRALLVDLNKQRVSAWIYESIDDEITPGEDIETACKKQIDICDLFIPVISDGAFSSIYAKMEVDYALKYVNNKLFFPIVLTENNNWPKPYDYFYNRKYGYNSNLKTSDIKPTIETISEKICKMLNIDYETTSDINKRLPLKRKIISELRGSQSIRKNYKTADIGFILSICQNFEKAYEDCNYTEASTIIETIINLISWIFPEEDIYYPYIAKGIVDLELSFQKKIIPDRSDNIFITLIKKNHPKLDENAYAGQANIELFSGKPKNALKYYEIAKRYIGDQDIALQHNILLAKIIAGNVVHNEDVSLLEKYIRNGIITKQRGSIDRIYFLYVLYLCYIGDIDKAVDLSNKVKHEISDDLCDLLTKMIDTILNFAETNVNCKFLDKAFKLIDFILKFENTLSAIFIFYLYYKKSWILYDRGELEMAINVLYLMKKKYPRSIKVTCDLAVMLTTKGEESKAYKYCLDIIDYTSHTQIEPDVTSKEFNYILGIAHWLIGNSEIAIDFFRRSKSFSTKYYSEEYYWLSPPLIKDKEKNPTP
jgi:tetratricopeptide (TPR) repeat protein